MKATRVYVTLAVAGGLVAGFFLAPLPIASRVRETGLVETEPTAAEGVLLPEPARLLALEVRPGQRVGRGQVLGRFVSEPLDVELARAQARREQERRSAERLEQAFLGARSDGNSAAAQRYQVEAETARDKAAAADKEMALLTARREKVRELRAPRDGVVLAAPVPDEVGKLFDRGFAENTPVFVVGDPARLRVRVPVNPPDYRLIKDDLQELERQKRPAELAVTVHVKGRSDRDFAGKIRVLPPQNAETVPVQLTQRGGGPLAVKPGGDPNVLVPLAQVYLVEVEITDPDAAVDPGQLAVVKIHTRWRSAAWWAGRTLANALDLGLY